MRQVEFPRLRALASPFEFIASRGVELHHARIAVAVAHVERAVRQHRDIGWQIKVTLIRAGPPALAEREQQFAVVRKLEHLMPPHVGEPHVVLMVEREPVRHDELPPAPLREHLATLSVEHRHRRLCERLLGKRRRP